MQIFEKHSTQADLRDEAAALMWLAQAEKTGGIHVAAVLQASPHTLQEERVQEAPPSKQAAEKIGRGLAYLHAAGASWWGAPPPGMRGPGYVIGDTLTEVVRDEKYAASTWGAYFAKTRIEPFVAQLTAQGFFSPQQQRSFVAVCTRLRAGDFDSAQPTLVGSHPARLHGDLWTGNVLYNRQGSATLIDPMAHGGHVETDLAMLQLFGYPYLSHVLAAYQEVSPLDEGWQDRVALHQLAPLLHHCLLFGSSYLSQTLAAANSYT